MTKEQVVRDNTNLIYKIASKFYGVSKEELFQAGVTGLLKALQQYKHNSNAKFSTFAYKYIFGEMYVLANKKAIKVTRDTLKLYKYIEKSRFTYAQKLGYIPGNLELSHLLKIPLTTIDYVCASSIDTISLDNDNECERSYYETIPSEEYVSHDDKMWLYEGLEKLPEEEKRILYERYFNDETQSVIAKKYNTSQVRVSRLEKKGLTRMRKILETT